MWFFVSPPDAELWRRRISTTMETRMTSKSRGRAFAAKQVMTTPTPSTYANMICADGDDSGTISCGRDQNLYDRAKCTITDFYLVPEKLSSSFSC